MRNLILSITIVTALCGNAYSQSKQESIKELFRVMDTESITDQILATMLPAMQSQTPASADPAKNAQMNELMGAVTQDIIAMTKRMIAEDMVVIYDKYFTQSEINDFIAFYKSPSGQKFLKVTPAAQKDLFAVMMQKYMPEIQRSVKARMESIKPK